MMENNNGNRKQSHQRDWDANDQNFNRGRNYENRNQRPDYGPGENQDYYNDQSWQNRSSGGYNEQYNNSYENQQRYQDDSKRRNFMRDYDQNRERNNDGENRNQNRNFDQRNYRSGYGNDRNHGDRNWWDRSTDEVASWFGNDEAERRRQMDKIYGPHKGKGPKGYTRSDERITEDINDKLYHDSYIDASNIEVKVTNGEAILSGIVDSRESKHRTEDLVESMPGVKNVQNQLKVSSGNTSIFERSNVSETDSNRKKNSMLS